MTNLYLTLERNVISSIYVFTVHTDSLLESFYFPAGHIGDIIKKLDPNKGHGYDLIPYGNHWKLFLKTA